MLMSGMLNCPGPEYLKKVLSVSLGLATVFYLFAYLFS